MAAVFVFVREKREADGNTERHSEPLSEGSGEKCESGSREQTHLSSLHRCASFGARNNTHERRANKSEKENEKEKEKEKEKGRERERQKERERETSAEQGQQPPNAYRLYRCPSSAPMDSLCPRCTKLAAAYTRTRTCTRSWGSVIVWMVARAGRSTCIYL